MNVSGVKQSYCSYNVDLHISLFHLRTYQTNNDTSSLTKANTFITHLHFRDCHKIHVPYIVNEMALAD